MRTHRPHRLDADRARRQVARHAQERTAAATPAPADGGYLLPEEVRSQLSRVLPVKLDLSQFVRAAQNWQKTAPRSTDFLAALRRPQRVGQ